MLNETSPEEFWRTAVHFRVVADSRIEALGKFYDIPTTVFCRYWPGASRELRNSFEKLRNKWKKNLFDDESPQQIFISGTSDVSFPW